MAHGLQRGDHQDQRAGRDALQDLLVVARGVGDVDEGLADLVGDVDVILDDPARVDDLGPGDPRQLLPIFGF